MEKNKERTAPIYAVSGGKGLAGNNMIQSLLIQYPNNNIPVIIVPNVSTVQELEEVVLQAKKDGGLITHTMVNPDLRKKLNKLGKNHNVKTIDFMGKLANYLDNTLNSEPLKHPGLFREINAEYFDRIEAIEFTLNHDDGLQPHRLENAEIILTGVSRTGKTPLSIYLAMYGWKVANVPIVNGIPVPKELYEVDPRRVFGLNISAQNLIAHRIKRMQSFNMESNTPYTEKKAVNEEIRNALFVFDRGGFTVLNVNNKPIESSANEILNIMTDRFDYQGRKLKSPYKENGDENK